MDKFWPVYCVVMVFAAGWVLGRASGRQQILRMLEGLREKAQQAICHSSSTDSGDE